MRCFVLAIAATVLVGCSDVADGITESLSRIGSSGDATGEGIRTLAVLGGDVRVRGPEGYCVDQTASNARRGFAVLAGCAILSPDAAIMPTLDGLITVQFGDEETASVVGNETALAAFLESAPGRGLLAEDGEPESIDGVTTQISRQGVMVRFQDQSGIAFDNTGGVRWRGFLDVQGRLATINILSFDRNPLSRGEGERLLNIAMAELAEVNGSDVAAQ